MEKLQTIIFFIRHGDTDMPYSPDPALDNHRVLTERGKQQLKKVGEYLKEFKPAVIYTSPRRRTVESARAIQEVIGLDCPLIEASELFEIYGDAAYRASSQAMPDFLTKLVRKHVGSHVICVSHGDTIQGALDALRATSEEASFPCQTAEGYRLVFAGQTFVECQKIRPADAI